MLVRMSDPEKKLFESFLRCANSYLEFGSGGSTDLALKTLAGPVYSIDSDQEWLDRVRQNVSPEQSERLKTFFVDIGRTGQWGVPTDVSRKSDYRNYHTKIWDCLDATKIDLFLIDGRFRVQCFLESVLRCRNDAILMFHDYHSRSYYHSVEKFARKIAEAEDMAAFVPERRHHDQIANFIAELDDNSF